MLEWHRKEKPIFTGITRGTGGFGFGASSGDDGGEVAAGGAFSCPAGASVDAAAETLGADCSGA